MIMHDITLIVTPLWEKQKQKQNKLHRMSSCQNEPHFVTHCVIANSIPIWGIFPTNADCWASMCIMILDNFQVISIQQPVFVGKTSKQECNLKVKGMHSLIFYQNHNERSIQALLWHLKSTLVEMSHKINALFSVSAKKLVTFKSKYILPHKVKMQYVQFSFHASYFFSRKV